MNSRLVIAFVVLLGCAGPASGQSGERARPLPPGYGSLSQTDLSLRMQNDELEIRFVPLSPRVLPLLARDAYQSFRTLMENNRRGIDSVAARAGVSQPGLALVTFFGRRPDVRFDAQTLTILVRNRIFRPLGLLPLTPRFTSQQLGVRDQVSAIYLFEEDLPVDDSFTVSYGALNSEDWESKQQLLNRERARVTARSRGAQPDTSR
ncbi:MAG TPA: hypothetical protein VFX42_02340 [Gemmatimonadales bacterium]|nr:hypothetical protein [Gemmatimonadales bacterium]